MHITRFCAGILLCNGKKTYEAQSIFHNYLDSLVTVSNPLLIPILILGQESVPKIWTELLYRFLFIHYCCFVKALISMVFITHNADYRNQHYKAYYYTQLFGNVASTFFSV